MAQCKFEKLAHLHPFGMLSGLEKASFEAHVAKCESCAAIARDAKRIGLMYKTRPAAQPLPGFEQRIAWSIKKKSPSAPAGFDWMSFLGFNKTMFPVAAGLALVMAIFMFTSVGNIFAESTYSAGASPSAQTSQTAPGGHYMAGQLDDAERALLSDSNETALGFYYKKLGNK